VLKKNPMERRTRTSLERSPVCLTGEYRWKRVKSARGEGSRGACRSTDGKAPAAVAGPAQARRGPDGGALGEVTRNEGGARPKGRKEEGGPGAPAAAPFAAEPRRGGLGAERTGPWQRAEGEKRQTSPWRRPEGGFGRRGMGRYENFPYL